MNYTNFKKKAGLTGTFLMSILFAKAQVVTYTASVGSITSWTVPCGVTSITVSISGAVGGGDPGYSSGGSGVSFTQAITSGFSPSDVLKLAPGTAGGSQSSVGTGGGGGSFVYDATSTNLLAAAGGGGGGGYESGSNGYAGSLTTAGVAGYGGAPAGINELGGAAGVSSDNGGGGAGWLGNGGSGNGGGGNDYANGLGGGAGHGCCDGGGFGGGGGGGYNGGGGGGGYNGGGGGSGSGGWEGGGGGSGYWNGSFINASSPSASNRGNGSITISYLAPVTIASKSATGVSCFNGNNGTATVIPTGGSSPYTYSWNPGGNTNANATGLSAGIYTITVTDQGGCTATVTVAVTQPTQVTATISAQINIPCNGGNNGSATVTASGGTSAYYYTWAPVNETNATATGLSAGCYTITVADQNGCIATAITCITQPVTLALGINAISEVSCSGGNNGSLAANPSGGTFPYTYSWSPIGGTSDTATGLSAGTYMVTVIDSNGCMDTASAAITQPNQLTATMGTPMNVSCKGGNNGSAIVTAGGGTSPYAYSWSPIGGISDTATGLTAGTYTITITDSNGCMDTTSVFITQPATALVIADTVIATVTCNGGNNGSAIVTAGGGTSPYAYSWSPIGGASDTATGLTAGTYTVTVTDSSGCADTESVLITQPATALVVTDTIIANVTCSGESNGSALSGASGGTAPYTYLWNNGGTTDTATGLSAGTYTIYVSDANGCAATASAGITEPALISIVSYSEADNGHSAGAAWINVSGGTGPYTYLWTPGGNTTDSITQIDSGSYCCTVEDAHGCTDSACVTIKSTLGIANITYNSGDIKVYPNPNNGVFTIQSSVISGQSSVEIYNVLGEQVYSHYQITKSSNYQINLSIQPNGVYLYRVISDSGDLIGEGKLIIQK